MGDLEVSSAVKFTDLYGIVRGEKVRRAEAHAPLFQEWKKKDVKAHRIIGMIT